MKVTISFTNCNFDPRKFFTIFLEQSDPFFKETLLLVAFPEICKFAQSKLSYFCVGKIIYQKGSNSSSLIDVEMWAVFLFLQR